MKRANGSKGDKPKNGESQDSFPMKIVVFLAALGFLILSFVGYSFVNEHSARIAFVTTSTLSMFTLAVIALQAVIYRKQWDV